jgi:hypothetical protein
LNARLKNLAVQRSRLSSRYRWDRQDGAGAEFRRTAFAPPELPLDFSHHPLAQRGELLEEYTSHSNKFIELPYADRRSLELSVVIDGADSIF